MHKANELQRRAVFTASVSLCNISEACSLHESGSEACSLHESGSEVVVKYAA